jgi:AraC-like DNA-binding protein
MQFINILLWTSLFGFILVSLIVLKRSTNRLAALFLAAFYFMFSVFCLQTYIIEVGLLPKMTWFYGWPLQLYALIPVALYFYFVTLFNDGFRWKPAYLLLFIPWLISLTDVVFFYAQPESFRASILDDAIRYPEKRFNAVYGLLSIKSHYLIRYLAGLIMMLMLLPGLVRFVQINQNEKSKRILNRWLSVLWILVTGVSVLWLIWILSLMNITLIPAGTFIYQLLIFIFHVLVLLIGIIPLYFPTVLYGFPIGDRFLQKRAEAIKESGVPEDHHPDASDIKFGLVVAEVQARLEETEKEQLYLKPDFDQTLLAARLGMPTHHLSYFLNQHHSTTFSNYRNQLRINYACTCIQSGYLKQNTIEALAGHCGYSSRSAFTKIFKSITGLSPSEYGTALENNPAH